MIYVHKFALCESTEVGAGTRVWAWAHVMAGATVGADCNIGDHAFIENGACLGDRVTVKNGVMVWDGVTVDDDVFLGPGVVFTNDLRPRVGIDNEVAPTHVKRGATIGANATVVCGTIIGQYAFVAAGAVVTKDVAAYTLVAGNPARWVGRVCRCGRRLVGLTCPCGR